MQQIGRYPAGGGTPTAVLATGFTTTYNPRLGDLQVDGASNVYVSAEDDATPRLLKHAPTGGSPRTLLTGHSRTSRSVEGRTPAADGVRATGVEEGY
ncbi:hypothetical protein [Allobranchiibius sp. GilTou38]|uniref:hypothetical protein n=1 Tax=Allobranchiibius sp. GilTou38 TaxID=2815210 RepID=UPI001AA10FFA|nr:hypothetical protein [Allobranchiibius sp. GilTou38]MBO1767577.1 hypothetical protein [Allobranchiibius sp. GilTou38]